VVDVESPVVPVPVADVPVVDPFDPVCPSGCGLGEVFPIALPDPVLFVVPIDPVELPLWPLMLPLVPLAPAPEPPPAPPVCATAHAVAASNITPVMPTFRMPSSPVIGQLGCCCDGFK
jgi:hypothetical protein